MKYLKLFEFFATEEQFEENNMSVRYFLVKLSNSDKFEPAMFSLSKKDWDKFLSNLRETGAVFTEITKEEYMEHSNNYLKK